MPVTQVSFSEQKYISTQPSELSNMSECHMQSPTYCMSNSKPYLPEVVSEVQEEQEAVAEEAEPVNDIVPSTTETEMTREECIDAI